MGYGYSAGAAAIFFSMVWALACWRWVPWGEGGEEPLNSSGNGSIGNIGSIGHGGTPKAVDEGDSAGAAPTSVTSLAGGYQNI